MDFNEKRKSILEKIINGECVPKWELSQRLLFSCIESLEIYKDDSDIIKIAEKIESEIHE